MSTAPLFTDQMQALAFLAWARPTLLQADSDAGKVMRGRDEALGRFGPLFRERAASLSAEDVSAFLSFEENNHWTGLHRQQANLLSNLESVRKAVRILLEPKPSLDNVGDRFDKADGMVKGFGEGIITPILFVAYPEDFGVWNSKSKFALELLGLWRQPARGESKGQTYRHVNNQLYHARGYLNKNLPDGVHPVDLWTIDYFWHAIKVMHDDGRLMALVETFKQRS